MRTNGESIYGTTKSPFRRLPFDGRCTMKGNTLYLHVFTWPADGIVLTGLKTAVTAAKFLDGGAAAPVEATKDEAGTPVLRIKAPAQPDPAATVVALTLAGPPEVEAAPAIRPDAQGKLALKAIDAEIHGNTAQYESGDGKDNIGYWIKKDDYVSWDVIVPAAKEYSVEVTYACENNSAGSEYVVAVGESKTTGKVAPTGAWNKFTTEPLGKLSLPAGRSTLTVKATSMPRGAVMNLQLIRLSP
jgi:alpha-L-fucosidase